MQLQVCELCLAAHEESNEQPKGKIDTKTDIIVCLCFKEQDESKVFGSQDAQCFQTESGSSMEEVDSSSLLVRSVSGGGTSTCTCTFF
jgi:hypothetical protein